MRYRGKKREGERVSHNGRRMSKKRTVNGQRNQRGGRKGLVSRTLSPVGRRTVTPTKVEKVSGRFPPLRSRLQHTQPSLPLFPSFSFSLSFLFSSFRFLRCSLARDFPLPNRHCARSLAQPNCNGICLSAEEEP